MNNKQKIILIVGSVLIIAALIVWLSNGGEIFTKTRVLVERKDELFGTTYKEWQDKLVIGLDYAGGFSAIVLAVMGVLLFVFRTKKEEKKSLQ